MLTWPTEHKQRGWQTTDNCCPIDPKKFYKWIQTLGLPRESADFSPFDIFDVLEYLQKKLIDAELNRLPTNKTVAEK